MQELMLMGKQDHVLIVDDDPDIRHLLADYLEAASYRPFTAAGGQEM